MATQQGAKGRKGAAGGKLAGEPVLPNRLANKVKSQAAATASQKGQDISNNRSGYINQSIKTLRDQNKPAAALRELARVDGTVGSAIFNFVEIAHTGYKVWAFDAATHQMSPTGTMVAQTILSRFDTVYDYTKGFSDKPTLRMAVEQMLLETVYANGFGVELVLDKELMPDRLQVVNYDSLTWVSQGDGLRFPKQQGNDGDVELNIPNFFVGELHLTPAFAYATPMLEPAINDAFFHREFIEDMRKTVRRAGNPRIAAKLITDKIVAACPLEVRMDPQKLVAWLEARRSEVEGILADLEPEDALTYYDSVEVDAIKMAGEKQDFVPLLNAISGLMATALKAPPSILGLRLEGSQSLSNTESMVFLKVASSIRRPVQDVMSRALTLACRLYGENVYVRFEFEPIDLRPENEVEAFRVMRQSRILELLSLGMISDEEAFVELGIEYGPTNYTPLSGTNFYTGKSSADQASKASPNDDPQGKALQGDSPKKAGGKSQ